MSRARRPAALTAAVTGIAAALAAGYVAGGLAGLTDAASLAALGVLILARATIWGQKPPPVRPGDKRSPRRRPAIRAEDFPQFSRIASDLEWAQMSRRHYEHTLRPTLARLAAALDRQQAVAGDLAAASPPGSPDRPGVDLATLGRIVTKLEGRP
jgi:hypothetical protein